ncbi:Six-hairpin glycosidase, partial [Setomelanomma holmii]
ITMVGDLLKAEPENIWLQLQTRIIFALAFCRAPARNPQPISASTSNNSFALYNGTGSKTTYDKILNRNTDEPHTTFPVNWFIDVDQFQPTHMDLSKPNTQDWLNGFYDDNLWWALAWINAYDVTHHKAYLRLAEGIFEAMTQIWPTYCFDGGIYWSWKRDYVNAIPNELFFSTAAHLANRAHNQAYYLDWAHKSMDWFVRGGMINQHGTINDGLTSDCQNNNGTTWSYNQGVILGGLVQLHRASSTFDATYLGLASQIAKAALAALSDANGILHDPCEPNCGGDGTQFKGIFMRNLQELQLAAPNEAFEAAIRKNAKSIWRYDRQADTFSVNWAGPFVAPTNASTHSSAMEALIADLAV